jgi:hypothetical protein
MSNKVRIALAAAVLAALIAGIVSAIETCAPAPNEPSPRYSARVMGMQQTIAPPVGPAWWDVSTAGGHLALADIQMTTDVLKNILLADGGPGPAMQGYSAWQVAGQYVPVEGGVGQATWQDIKVHPCGCGRWALFADAVTVAAANIEIARIQNLQAADASTAGQNILLNQLIALPVPGSLDSSWVTPEAGGGG